MHARTVPPTDARHTISHVIRRAAASAAAATGEGRCAAVKRLKAALRRTARKTRPSVLGRNVRWLLAGFSALQ